MTHVHRSKLSNQDSVFKDKEDPICSIPLTPNEDEVDMYALYAEIDKIRNEFQENFTTKHPWYPILEELVRTEEQYFNDIDSIVEVSFVCLRFVSFVPIYTFVCFFVLELHTRFRINAIQIP